MHLKIFPTPVLPQKRNNHPRCNILPIQPSFISQFPKLSFIPVGETSSPATKTFCACTT